METMKLVFGNESVDVDFSYMSTIILQSSRSVVRFKGEKWKTDYVESEVNENGFVSRSIIFKKC